MVDLVSVDSATNGSGGVPGGRDPEWDSLNVTFTLAVHNTSGFVVTGNGVSVWVAGSPSRTGSSGSLTASVPTGSIQPHSTVQVVTGPLVMRRGELDGVASWSTRDLSAMFFYQGVDVRCPTASLVNATPGNTTIQ